MATDRRLWFTHKCRFCSYLFVCEKDLVYHEATHTTPDFSCENCCAVFDDADQLNVHITDGCSVADSSADVGRQHVCRTCGEIFSYVRELYKHYVGCHMDSQSVTAVKKPNVMGGASVCANCGAMFSCAASLKVHLWKAHNLNCSQQQGHILETIVSGIVTSRDSRSSASCGQFLERDNDKPFKCSLCNWSFKYDFSFRAHLKMHEAKQRSLGELLRANCASQVSADDRAAVGHVGAELLAPSGSQACLPAMLPPVKRKAENCDDTDCAPGVKSTAVCDSPCSQSGCCLESTAADVTYCLPQLISNASSVVQPTELTNVEPSSPVIKQSTSTDRVSRNEEPLRFACKLCSFKCRYDFSYIAHLNQHNKLKELEIDDFQSHLVASSTQMPPAGSQMSNKITVKLVGTNANDANGHTQLVDGSGISYILLCPTSVDQTALLTNLPTPPQYDTGVCMQPAAESTAGDPLGPNVVLVDDASPVVGEELELTTRPDSDDVDFSVVPEMQFLDSSTGETLYVINEADLQVALPVAAVSDSQQQIVCGGSENEVVLSPQPADSHLLDVTNLCSDDDRQSDESDTGDMVFTCYYCNATFNNKHHLQNHILELHVE